MNMMVSAHTDVYSLLGFLGMAVIVVAYYLNQVGRISAQTYVYTLLNLFGAILLLISLCVHFNLGSFLIEVFWIMISIMGLGAAIPPKALTFNDALSKWRHSMRLMLLHNTSMAVPVA